MKKTGWPPYLLQDDCRKLFRWFADRIDARHTLRNVLKAVKQTTYPNCPHCRGLGYDASGLLCACVKEKK